METNFDLAAHLSKRLGYRVVVLRTDRDLDAFEDARANFARDGDRAALMRRLFALGVPADAIRCVLAGADVSAALAG